MRPPKTSPNTSGAIGKPVFRIIKPTIPKISINTRQGIAVNEKAAKAKAQDREGNDHNTKAEQDIHTVFYNLVK